VELVRPAPLASDRRAKAPRNCPHCGRVVSLATPHVQVARSGVRLFCSAECMSAALQGRKHEVAAATAAHASEPVEFERKPRLSRGKMFAIVLGIGCLSPCNHVAKLDGRLSQTAGMVTLPQTAEAKAARMFGPPVPDDEDIALEFMDELSGDRWIHPLPGPNRRMPIRSSRVFGAHRHGDRPGECRSGHCGVDIGGEIWGEPVLAVHEGVVERVKRVDEGNGGMYVRIAHREGTVITQYFHLAAIPRQLSAGDRVRAGQIIGLVGDTGVKESNPHLHFTISVKPSKQSREIYMDPEPLIALWPVKVPRDTGGADASFNPGVPLGAVGRPRVNTRGQPVARKAERKRKRTAKPESTEPATAESEDAAASEASEAADDPYESEIDSGDSMAGSSAATDDAGAAAPAPSSRFPFAPGKPAQPTAPGMTPGP
jgi:murein DD-endopeptidase MepM/ murein hydrolase activator NlpD